MWNKKLKIAISAGHNHYANGIFDVGAVSPHNGQKESDFTKATVHFLKIRLEEKGHTVLDVTPYNENFYDGVYFRGNWGNAQKNAHYARSEKVKKFNPDIYIDFHMNSGGGTGPECLVYNTSNNASILANKICSSISKKFNVYNRGVKARNYWSVNMHTHPSIIVEGGFLDSPKNWDLRKMTPRKMAMAIADAFYTEVKEVDRKDLPVSEWAKKDWEKAKELKITDGTRPRDYVTREEVISMIIRSHKTLE